MTKKRFNTIRSRLEMRYKKYGDYKPDGATEEFIVYIIERKHTLDKMVEEYAEGEK